MRIKKAIALLLTVLMLCSTCVCFASAAEVQIEPLITEGIRRNFFGVYYYYEYNAIEDTYEDILDGAYIHFVFEMKNAFTGFGNCTEPIKVLDCNGKTILEIGQKDDYFTFAGETMTDENGETYTCVDTIIDVVSEENVPMFTVEELTYTTISIPAGFFVAANGDTNAAADITIDESSIFSLGRDETFFEKIIGFFEDLWTKIVSIFADIFSK